MSITQDGYVLEQKTKNLHMASATEQELSDAWLDCYACIDHYPEIPSEIRMAFDISDKIELQRLIRKSFFGDHQ